VQLANEIVVEIQAGALKPDQPLPSEAALMRAHGMSRGTVRAAVRLLRGRAVVVTIQARGTFVAAAPSKAEP
jgi:GntR family transcriptional regulator